MEATQPQFVELIEHTLKVLDARPLDAATKLRRLFVGRLVRIVNVWQPSRLCLARRLLLVWS